MLKKLLNRFNSLSIKARFIFTFLLFVLVIAVTTITIGWIADDTFRHFLNHSEISNKLTDKDKKVVTSARNHLLIVGGAITAISLLMASIMSFLASNYFSSQIQRIFHLLKAYSEGDLDVRENVTTDNEIGQILKNLHHMAQQIKEKQTDLISVQKKVLDLYHHAPSMYCTLDLNGIIENMNETFKKVLGLIHDDFIGKPFTDFVTKNTQGVFNHDFKDFLMTTDSVKGVDFQLNSSNSKTIHVHMSWNYFTEPLDHDFKTHAIFQGKDIYGVRVNLNDITAEIESAKQKSILFETMSVVPKLLGTVIAVEELLQFLLDELEKAVAYDVASVLLSPAEGIESLSVAAINGLDGKGSALIGNNYAHDDPKLKYVMENHRRQVLDTFFFAELVPDSDQIKNQSSLVVPLIVIDEVIGALAIDRANIDGFGQDEIIMVEAFASIAAGAIQNVLLREELQSRTIEVKRTIDELESKDLTLQRELDMAFSIQQGILPEDSYEWNGIKILNHYNAMEKVGGDFYDFFHMPHGQLAIVIADVSGHGIPAALVTTMAKITFTAAAQKNNSPAKILEEVNQDMCQYIKTDDYLTVFFLTIDRTYQVTYVNAGHQVGLLYRKKTGKIESLDTPGYFVGLMGEMGESYEESTIQLDFGDRIMLYTDGIIESTNLSKEEFGIERLEKLFLDHADKTIEELQTIVIDGVKTYSKGISQKDDLSLVLLELDEKYERVLQTIFEGKKNFKLGNYKESMFFFKKALKADPNNLEVILNTAECYFHEHQFEESIKYFETYITLKSNNPLVHYHLALSYFKLKDFDQSIKSNKMALDIDKNYVKSLHLLGLTQKKLSNYEEAKHYFSELLKIEPDNKKAKMEINYLESLD